MTARIAVSALTLILAVGFDACKRTPSDTGSPPPPATAPAGTGQEIADSARGAPPPPTSTTRLDPPAAASEFRDAAQWLPQGSVAGWQQSGDVTRSTAANLFQLIDGAAPSYERYGLRNFARTDYRQPGTSMVTTVEVYEFASTLGAFGRYSLMLSDGRDPSALEPQAVHRGGGGYQGTTQLAFWKGRALIQINLTDASEEPNEATVAATARAALPAFGEAIDRLLPVAEPLPGSPLPTDGLVWGGATYLADGVFGADRSGPGWVGHFRAQDGKRYRLAILGRATNAEAGEAFRRLRSGDAQTIRALGDEAFSATGEGTGEMVVVRRGGTVFAIADAGVPGLAGLDRDHKIAAVRSALAAPAAPTTTDGPAR